jgi:hypothetical protein
VSAWIVSVNHLRAVVTGAVKYGVVEPDAADYVGQLLELENRRSVDYRYDEHNAAASYQHVAVEVDDITLLKQLDCYEYQSCEHSEWESSEAFAIVAALQDVLADKLPANIKRTRAYDDAPWGLP